MQSILLRPSFHPRSWIELALAAIAIIGAALGLVACGGGGSSAEPTVAWSQATLEIAVTQGTYQALSLQLASGEPIDDASVLVSGDLASMLRAELVTGETLLKNAINPVSGDVMAGVEATPGSYRGTLSAVSASRGLLASLPVHIQVQAPSSTQVQARIADPTPDRISRSASGQYVVKDEIVVVVSSNVANPDARIIEIATQVGAQIIGSVPGMSVYQLRLATSDEAVIDAQVVSISTMAGVDAASASLLGSAMKFAAEGLYPANSWSLTSAQGPNRHLEFIRAPQAWDVTTGLTGDAAIPVAIIDDEFDYGHPDLVGNIQSWDAVLRTYVGTRPTAVSGGHGTQVAGALCARATDSGTGIGVVGVAWNCRLRLYSYSDMLVAYRPASGQVQAAAAFCTQTFHQTHPGICTSLASLPRVLEKMKKAVTEGAQVVNMSLGFIETDCPPNCTPESSQLAGLARRVDGVLRRGFDEGLGKKVLWVIAAGNENRDVRYQSPASFKKHYPAYADQIIVAAGTFTVERPTSANGVDPSGAIDTDVLEVGRLSLGNTSASAGSNYGSGGDVDIGAPWFVSTTLPRYCTGYLAGCDTEPITSFGTSSYVQDAGGTSFAAPQVAGVAVLVWSHQPDLTAAQVKRCIVDGTRIRVTGHDFKVVDAKRAVDCETASNAPTVMTDPQSLTVPEGQSATFTVTAKGTNVDYEWRKGTPAQSQPAPGALNRPTYDIPLAHAADDGSTFFVIVSNSTGSATSNVAELGVTPSAAAPVITSQPVDVAVVVGQSATFAVSASGTGLSYQWRKGPPGAGVPAPGVNNGPSYTMPTTIAADNGVIYSVVVSNAAGSVASTGATLMVSFASTAPSITAQPHDVSVSVGQSATFSVTAVGTGTLSYQWRKNGVNVACSTGASCPTYTVPSAALVDNGSVFSVLISNSAGPTTSSNATLTVTDPGSATAVVSSVSVSPGLPLVGMTATFSVNGSNLQAGYVLALPGCTPTEITGGSATQRQFTCTLTVAGANLAGTVATPSGALLYAFVVTVGTAPPTQAALSIGLGNYHTCGVTAAGVLKCWGNNSGGELGDGTATQRNTPVTVLGLGQGVVAVASGPYHACALTSLGGVKCWGANGIGQLGDGTTIRRLSPVDVSGLSSGVIAISVGTAHTCAVVAGGGVKCWGGNGPEVGAALFTSHLTPVDVPGLSGGVTAIALGNDSSCALTSTGGVKCWGYNNKGQIGGGSTYQSVPFDIAGLSSNVIAIDAGYEHICVLTSAGGVKCWGDNFFGKLGNGSTTQSSTPVDVVGLTQGVVSVAAGDNETCAVTSAGGVMCWGDDGTGTRVRTVPVSVAGLSAGVVRVGVGGNHVCAVIAIGGLKCWEANNLGQVGDGTSNNYRALPADVVGF